MLIRIFTGCSVALVGIAILFCARVSAQETAFQFAVIGDTGYSPLGIQEFKSLLASLNERDLAFVAHVGDFQAGANNYRIASGEAMPCTEDRLHDVFKAFQSVRHPLIVTPGDNDWTDCHSHDAVKLDPLNSLALIRMLFFPEGKSLGKRSLMVKSQAGDPLYSRYRENLRWSMGGVTFATVHIVGSNDNFGRTPEMDAEHRERKSANIAWIRNAFAHAKDSSRGLVILTQANPSFQNHWSPVTKTGYLRMIPGVQAPTQPQATVYDDYIHLLSEELETYDKPVLFIHGDTHRFQLDQPLFSTRTNRRFDNFIRLETFGHPDTHWVRVTVNPTDAALFSFRTEIVPANRAKQPLR